MVLAFLSIINVLYLSKICAYVAKASEIIAGKECRIAQMTENKEDTLFMPRESVSMITGQDSTYNRIPKELNKVVYQIMYLITQC